MGKNSNEITTLHLVKTYCLPTLLFGCEIWNLSDRSVHKLNVASLAWNNCFRCIYFEFSGEKVLSHCSFAIVVFVGPTQITVLESYNDF